jgi:hypothetical protein
MKGAGVTSFSRVWNGKTQHEFIALKLEFLFRTYIDEIILPEIPQDTLDGGVPHPRDNWDDGVIGND